MVAFFHIWCTGHAVTRENILAPLHPFRLVSEWPDCSVTRVIVHYPIVCNPFSLALFMG